MSADWQQRAKKRGTNLPPATNPLGILQGDGNSNPSNGGASLLGSPAVPNTVVPAVPSLSKPRPVVLLRSAPVLSDAVVSDQADRHVHRFRVYESKVN